MEPKWDSEKGTVTLVKGDDTKTLDLNKEEDRIALMKGYQRGWYFDDEASKELGDLRQKVKGYQNWDNAFEAAKKSDEAMEQFVDMLEKGLGRQLTRKEEAKIKEGDDSDFIDPSAIKALKQELADLKKQQELRNKADDDEKTKAVAAQLEKEADILEKKYPGTEDGKKPAFKRQEIYTYMWENNLEKLSLEDAFKLKYYDKLTEAAKEDFMADLKKQNKDRKNLFVEDGEGTSGSDLKDKPKPVKSHYELVNRMKETVAKKGLDLFQ